MSQPKWRNDFATEIPCTRERRYLREMVIYRDGPQCFWCEAPLPDGSERTLDHLVPRSLGGSNDAKNLVLSCRPCNEDRGAKVAPMKVCEQVKRRTKQMKRRVGLLPAELRPQWFWFIAEGGAK